MSAAILIVGAGPTGLVLALRLRRANVPFRIVDEQDGPGRQSRALVVHARTLEFYQQLGLAQQIVAAGTPIETVRLRDRGADTARISLKAMGEGLSPFPFALCLPQDEHERLLINALADEGLHVEWGTRLDRLNPKADRVAAVLARAHGQTDHADFAYIAGCDGAHSRVREQVGIEFGGGRYDRLYYVADVKPRERIGMEFVIALDAGDFGLRLPSRKGLNERLIGYVPGDAEDHPTFEDVQPSAERLLGLAIEEVNWFSTYRVHHRVAAKFRIGRCFLLGDAGHLHSPVGGQGMNTGIGDAINLGWKLAQVMRGLAEDQLLDSYEVERIAFARSLVATTDRAFQIISNPGPAGRLFRTWFLPKVVPIAAGFAQGRRALFRLVSQIRVSYRNSPLSEGQAGSVAGGDRLPWVAPLDNYRPLQSLEWQLHVFEPPPRGVAEGAGALGLPLHVFRWTDDAGRAGFSRGAVYLVRPDGHVAWAQRRPDLAPIQDYARRHALRFAG